MASQSVLQSVERFSIPAMTMSQLKLDAIGVRVLLMTCACTLTASCAADDTAPTADFEVVTTVSPSVANIGERIAVTVTATNISTQSQTILTNDCLTAFAVLDSAATHVGPSAEQFCAASGKMVTILPGAQYAVTQEWTGDAMRLSPNSQPRMVEPGSYTVSGNLRLGANIRIVAATVRLIP